MKRTATKEIQDEQIKIETKDQKKEREMMEKYKKEQIK